MPNMSFIFYVFFLDIEGGFSPVSPYIPTGPAVPKDQWYGKQEYFNPTKMKIVSLSPGPFKSFLNFHPTQTRH